MSEESSKEIEQLKQCIETKAKCSAGGNVCSSHCGCTYQQLGFTCARRIAKAQKSHEAGESCHVTADSLSQIKSKLEEQELHIQTQDEEIARMRAEVMAQSRKARHAIKRK